MKKFKLSLLVKLIVLVVVVYGTFTLVDMSKQLSAQKDEAAALTALIGRTEGENAQLQEDIDALNTERGTQDIARNELGLVAPGEIIFREANR